LPYTLLVDVKTTPGGVACARADLRGRRQVAPPLAHERHVLEVAVHLVGRREDDARRGGLRARGLEHVERAARVDLEVLHRVDEAGGDGHLRGEVEDLAAAGDGRAHGGGVAHVLLVHLEPLAVPPAQPGQVLLHAGAREVVEDAHPTSRAQQPVGEVGAHEAGAAGDQHPIPCPRAHFHAPLQAVAGRPGRSGRSAHTVSPRAASSALACSTRSWAT
jgi:hypothetical protein